MTSPVKEKNRPSGNSRDGEWWPDYLDLNAVSIGNTSIYSKPVATDGERGRHPEIAVGSGALRCRRNGCESRRLAECRIEAQLHGGRYFLHAHSHSADSWEQPTVVDFMNRLTDRSLFGPNVHLGMNTLTRWLTNSGCVAQALSSLNHSSTVRPTIMSAMSQQLQSDLGTSDTLQHRPPLPKLDILAVDADEEPPAEWEAEDDVKEEPLDPREVKTVRDKDIQYLWDMDVYEFSTEAESRTRTGRNPVGLKWIGTNKGSAEAPRYRSRLVCTEVRHKGVEPIFSATPPPKTLRVPRSVASQEDVFQAEHPFLISTAYVSRAHFYACAVRDVYVRLADENPKAKQPGVCHKLRKTMYGSLDAAQRWRLVLEAGGISRGAASPCHFFHNDLQTYILVHGDDFFIVGRREGRKHVLSLLLSAYELRKVETLGPGPSQSRTASFLGRTLTLRQWGIECEPDGRRGWAQGQPNQRFAQNGKMARSSGRSQGGR